METSPLYETLVRLIFLWAFIAPIIILVQAYLAWSIWSRSNKSVRVSEDKAAKLEHDLRLLKSNHVQSFRNRWLEQIGGLSFANEVEVEIKFVYPLLLHLGYEDDEFSVRYKTNIRAGHESLVKEADWIVWRRGTNNKNPVMIIEAKAPVVPIDREVQQQARSYAFAAKAPKYMLTNGNSVLVFELGIEDDTCLFKSITPDLRARWDDLHRIVGAD